jgi:hypothetical protein
MCGSRRAAASTCTHEDAIRFGRILEAYGAARVRVAQYLERARSERRVTQELPLLNRGARQQSDGQASGAVVDFHHLS